MLCGFYVLPSLCGNYNIMNYIKQYLFKPYIFSSAIKLRNAFAGVVFVKSLSESLNINVSSIPAMLFCTEDGDVIMEMVLKGTFILVQSLALVLFIGFGFLIGEVSMIWPSLGLIVFIIIAVGFPTV